MSNNNINANTDPNSAEGYTGTDNAPRIPTTGNTVEAYKQRLLEANQAKGEIQGAGEGETKTAGHYIQDFYIGELSRLINSNASRAPGGGAGASERGGGRS